MKIAQELRAGNVVMVGSDLTIGIVGRLVWACDICSIRPTPARQTSLSAGDGEDVVARPLVMAGGRVGGESRFRPSVPVHRQGLTQAHRL